MRTATVEILGKQYRLAYSAKSQMAMEALKKTGFDIHQEPTRFFWTLLSEELRAGYRLAQLRGETAEQPPKAEDLEDLMDPQDLGALVPILQQVQAGDRNVEAKPPKKEAPEGSGD